VIAEDDIGNSGGVDHQVAPRHEQIVNTAVGGARGEGIPRADRHVGHDAVAIEMFLKGITQQGTRCYLDPKRFAETAAEERDDFVF
jgi:hypothetical protein